MPKIALTDVTIRTLRPPEKGQTTYTDKSLPGFGLRVSQGGTKTFTVVYGANRQRATIGKYGIISLSEARKEAKIILAEHTLGRNKFVPISFAKALERFLAACEQKNKPRTVQDYRRLLNRHFRFGRVQLADVKKHDLTRRIDKLKKTPSEQNYAFVVARAFFRWAVRNNFLEHSPLEGLQMPARTRSRDRVLNESELGEVFQHALETSYPYGPIVALLILTGQRRGEIAALRWDWINLKEQTITLPDTITKNRRTHTFPFGDKAAEVLQTLPDVGQQLFPARTSHVRCKPSSCFNGWSKAKKDFNAGLENVPPYTLHDLRRTFSSSLAALGTPIHVTERLLNHATGAVSGVAAIYNRHSYMEEMRGAVHKYEQHVLTCSGSN